MVAAPDGGPRQGAPRGTGHSVSARQPAACPPNCPLTRTSTALRRSNRPNRSRRYVQQLEHWLFPACAGASGFAARLLAGVCEVQPAKEHPALHTLDVGFNLFRPRTGEKFRPLVRDHRSDQPRGARAGTLFAAKTGSSSNGWRRLTPIRTISAKSLSLSGLELLQWLARWGHNGRLEWGPHNHHVIEGDRPLSVIDAPHPRTTNRMPGSDSTAKSFP